MVEAACGERVEGAGELGGARRRQVETERLDGDETSFGGVVRAKDRAQRSGADLVQHAERSETFWDGSWDGPLARQ